MNMTAGNVKAAMKTAGAVSADLWQVPFDQLRIMSGFNVRERTQKYADRVRWVADSIKANGFYKDKPLAGFVAAEDGADIIYITDGHTRYDALELAIAEGAEIAAVPVVVKPRGTSMEDMTIDLIVGNEGNPLTTYEQAVVCARLAKFGMEPADIRARVGYASVQYVEGLLTLAGAPLAIRKMVIEGAVSATVAIDTIRKHKDKALDVLTAALAKAAGGRVTPKAMPGAAVNKAIKKQAVPMYDAIKAVHADPGIQFLSPELRELIDNLLKAIAK